MKLKRAIIFVNGNFSDVTEAKKIVTNGDFLVATDGGVRHILKLGLIPHIVIGDLDSTPLSIQKKLERTKTEWIKYPVKKDKTDFELAIDYCLEKKFKEIIIFGVFGDRVDHFIANILLLANVKNSNKSIKIVVIEGDKKIYILNKNIIINGRVGDELSIIPLNQKLEGIVTEGLEYKLNNESLSLGSTKGISNVFEKTLVKIATNKGTALVIHNLSRKKNLKNNK